MKIFFSMAALALMATGCRTPLTIPRAIPADLLCTSAPVEDESGARVYPMATAYSKLPHLGQIYTALDCGDTARVQGVQGFKDGKYESGVTLRWKANPTAQNQEVLLKLGFERIDELTWRTSQTLTLDELLLLKPLISAPEFESEDCVRCG